MRIAIPVEDGRLSQHFGRAGEFIFFNVDPAQREILSSEERAAPPHEPGRLPAWLKQHGAGVVIAGGMGQRAAALLEANAIQVICGAPEADPRTLVELYLRGSLAEGPNGCDHTGREGHHCRCRH
ncbi:MAG: NifB/NifX family molybdenum-iron cluster-binding protein [Bryobacteraceae bacterium]